MKSPIAVRVETTWTQAERKIARKAYDAAFARQCGTIAAKAKKMLASIQLPYGVWKVHDYLTRERKRVDLTYDWRYSVLLSVLGRLQGEGWLDAADLEGLSEDKMREIRQFAQR